MCDELSVALSVTKHLQSNSCCKRKLKQYHELMTAFSFLQCCSILLLIWFLSKGQAGDNWLVWGNHTQDSAFPVSKT